jgi:hypothetical protein
MIGEGSLKIVAPCAGHWRRETGAELAFQTTLPKKALRV